MSVFSQSINLVLPVQSNTEVGACSRFLPTCRSFPCHGHHHWLQRDLLVFSSDSAKPFEIPLNVI